MNRARLEQQRDSLRARHNAGRREFTTLDALALLDALLAEEQTGQLITYTCSACGEQWPKWVDRCPMCATPKNWSA